MCWCPSRGTCLPTQPVWLQAHYRAPPGLSFFLCKLGIMEPPCLLRPGAAPVGIVTMATCPKLGSVLLASAFRGPRWASPR